MAEGSEKIWFRVGLSFLAGVVLSTVAVSACAPLKKKAPQSSISSTAPVESDSSAPPRYGIEKTKASETPVAPSEVSTAAPRPGASTAREARRAAPNGKGQKDKSAPSEIPVTAKMLAAEQSVAAEKVATEKKVEVVREIAREQKLTQRSVGSSENAASADSRASLASSNNLGASSSITSPVVLGEPPVASAPQGADSGLNHPAAALPLPDDARAQAARALEESAERRKAASSKQATGIQQKSSHPAQEGDARARLSQQEQQAAERVPQRQFYLEVAFIALVLFCLLGAMWYRLNSDFGRGPRRRFDR